MTPFGVGSDAEEEFDRYGWPEDKENYKKQIKNINKILKDYEKRIKSLEHYRESRDRRY